MPGSATSANAFASSVFLWGARSLPGLELQRCACGVPEVVLWL